MSSCTRNSKLDALPVVELGRLIGIVTVTDVLTAEPVTRFDPTGTRRRSRTDRTV